MQRRLAELAVMPRLAVGAALDEAKDATAAAADFLHRNSVFRQVRGASIRPPPVPGPRIPGCMHRDRAGTLPRLRAGQYTKM